MVTNTQANGKTDSDPRNPGTEKGFGGFFVSVTVFLFDVLGLSWPRICHVPFVYLNLLSYFHCVHLYMHVCL